MEVTGKIIKALEVKRGTSSRGDWMLASYVIETSDRYPKKIYFEVFGEERIKRFNVEGLMSANQEVSVSFDIDASEYNGRWYNTIRAYDVRANYAKTNNEQMAAQTPAPEAESNADPLPY